MNFLKQNKKRAFILGMIALSFIVITFSYFYYSNINASKDPRVKHARELYEKYNEYTIQGDYDKVFALLDSIEFIYKKEAHFAESFEVGVLYNNRAATYLTMALYDYKPESYMLYSKDTLLQLAQISVQKSISIYENWIEEFKDKNQKQVKDFISANYLNGLEEATAKDKERYINNRVEEILTAQYETKRRLSVAYTNLGIINRHFEQYEKAINNYQKAIELWNQNLTAENNLNILIGNPLKKRSLIQKLFPPEQKENE